MHDADGTLNWSHQNSEACDAMCVIDPVHIQSAYTVQLPGTTLVTVCNLLRPIVLLQHHLITRRRSHAGGWASYDLLLPAMPAAPLLAPATAGADEHGQSAAGTD